MNTNCPKIGFLLKVDDDIYVNIYNLAKIVESYHKSGNFSIFGRSPNSGFPSHHYNNFGPVREPCQYEMTFDAWPWNSYPDYISGPVYLIHGSSILPSIPTACMLLRHLMTNVMHGNTSHGTIGYHRCPINRSTTFTGVQPTSHATGPMLPSSSISEAIILLFLEQV
ncbi:hypothetical protein OUZ56_021462 [Daphnia magna]|uniref:Hexosyltransferase n=1 Tax=Daphnia magna TaxID=35525 RepID=A0ABQ9ZHF7_9CRUS|nr:hypothetical protein OUZ56_021462 [Daphnia magna]